MSPDQQVILDSPARILFVGAGTKTGKTVADAVWILEGLLQGERCAWVGPWHKRTRTGFEHIKNMLLEWEGAGFAKTRDSDLTIDVFETTTGKPGRLECYSGENPDGIYGDAFDRIVIDEATRQPEAVFPAARSTTTATGGKIRVTFNTDRSARHWAIREFFRAKRGEEPTYAYLTMPTSASPYVAAEDIAQAKRTLPERVFEALYNARVAEDGAGAFTKPSLCARGQREEPRAGISYVIGVDLGRKRDYTVITVMDCTRKHVVEWSRLHNIDWIVQYDTIAEVAKRYNNARVTIDATGVGDPATSELIKRGVAVTPFIFSQPSKRELIENLIVTLEQRLISFPVELDVLLSELESYEFTTTASGNVSYNAPDGYHDDAVASLALAVRALGPLSTTLADLSRIQTGDSMSSDGALACI